MKALILNSGTGSRMGAMTAGQPKCMTPLAGGETILSRQLTQLCAFGITEVVITTGKFDEEIRTYCCGLDLPLQYTFVKNVRYAQTNYIYSIYCARDVLSDDILLLHGDLVFEDSVLCDLLAGETSAMAVSTTVPLPEKDFKAVVTEGHIRAVGISFFEHAVAAQPIYLLKQQDWTVWLDEIVRFCERGEDSCYAEHALNEVSADMQLMPLDVKDRLCAEVDTPEDLSVMNDKLTALSKKTVYLCFASDVLHGGHIAIIRKAARLGRLVVGVLSDEAVAGYRRFPLLPCEERRLLLRNISGVDEVIVQDMLSYTAVLRDLRPDYVVHGDNWRTDFQHPVRDEVLRELSAYGGALVEYPYTANPQYAALEQAMRQQLSLPDLRRGRLRRLLSMKPLVTVIEAHSGITGLIAEHTVVYENGAAHQFDGMWVSSLCDSTAKGKPDIELVDMSSRFRTIDDIMEVTTKPIILDGDTGGLTEHFVYTVRTLERMGVSAVIIEDKTGLKKNSLFGTEVEQTQDSIENFSEKIRAGKQAQKTREFMIIARIESLILERGMDDALQRAFAFTAAGADGIMIHSRRKSPDEIFEFVGKFRAQDSTTPIIVVPTSFNQVTEEEFARIGVNIVIYANHLTRSGFPAMQKTAESILTHHRAKEADEQYCMPIQQILNLIPEE